METRIVMLVWPDHSVRNCKTMTVADLRDHLRRLERVAARLGCRVIVASPEDAAPDLWVDDLEDEAYQIAERTSR